MSMSTSQAQNNVVMYIIIAVAAVLIILGVWYFYDKYKQQSLEQRINEAIARLLS